MTTHATHRPRPSNAFQDWKAEYAKLSARDRKAPLDPQGLERLGIVAFLAGDEAGSIAIHTRGHTAALKSGDDRQAARSAFWIAFALLGRRDIVRAAGWAARARRLLDQTGSDCVESGYVLLPPGVSQVASGDLAAAEITFAEAERIGVRFEDSDLTNLARQARGRVLIGLGRVSEGVALFDEVMVAVTAGEVTPLISGVVYCNVISACFEMLDFRRAHEWTEALNEWCEAQPSLVPYRGVCLAHRADIFRLRGRWLDALEEARRADRLLATASVGRGHAAYALAELHRLRGDVTAAEESYRQASEYGRSAQPGLALLRLAQGKREAACAAADRMIAERVHGRQRAEVLAAAVDIYLAAGALPIARRIADELLAMAATLGSAWPHAMAAAADGAVQLAAGDGAKALGPLNEALMIWRDLDAPYEAAQVQLLIGRACKALGDADGARLALESAAGVFRQLGAAPALAEVEALVGASSSTTPAGGLTLREQEVLRLIARGMTNRVIARELGISEKTVARHVSNIFTKLDLSTRAAATAYAFTHQLAP